MCPFMYWRAREGNSERTARHCHQSIETKAQMYVQNPKGHASF